MPPTSFVAASLRTGLTDDPRDDKIRELEWHNHKLRNQITELVSEVAEARKMVASSHTTKTKVSCVQYCAPLVCTLPSSHPLSLSLFPCSLWQSASSWRSVL